MKPITFANYRDKYDSIPLERSGGVLEMTLHTRQVAGVRSHDS